MLEDFLGPPTWRSVNGVNIWNLLTYLVDGFFELSQKTFTPALFLILQTPKMANRSRDKCIFFDKRDLSFMSCTAITS